MSRLTQDAFDLACGFIETQARPLEQTLLEHRFRGGSVDPVLEELVGYQNLDGGFGYALEPDVRTPESSALATAIGLKMLRELGCSAGHPMVADAVAYLLRSHDPICGVWRAVPESANGFPHAPWWHEEDGSLAETFGGFLIIPRVSILASLYHYRDIVPTDWLEEVGAQTIDCLESVDVLGTGGGSDLVYAIDLVAADGLPGSLRARLDDRIRRAIPDVVVRDSEQWSEYCITPLRVAPAPQAAGADLIEEELSKHLDYVIESQSQEGAWDPTWTWGGAYPESWEEAKREWQGILTLETLTSLRAYGRLRG